jgi:predicted HicB family RNase H-like nuclease
MDKRINIRIEPHIYEEICTAARKMGVSVATFARLALFEMVQKVNGSDNVSPSP